MGVQIVWTHVNNGVAALFLWNVFPRVSFVDAGVGDSQINGRPVKQSK